MTTYTHLSLCCKNVSIDFPNFYLLSYHHNLTGFHNLIKYSFGVGDDFKPVYTSKQWVNLFAPVC